MDCVKTFFFWQPPFTLLCACVCVCLHLLLACAVLMLSSLATARDVSVAPHTCIFRCVCVYTRCVCEYAESVCVCILCVCVYADVYCVCLCTLALAQFLQHCRLISFSVSLNNKLRFCLMSARSARCVCVFVCVCECVLELSLAFFMIYSTFLIKFGLCCLAIIKSKY